MMGWVNGMGIGITWMWILPVLFLTGLALFLGMIFRGWRGFPSDLSGDVSRNRKIFPEETAKDILERRYAQGEITREQYVQMKKDLE